MEKRKTNYMAAVIALAMFVSNITLAVDLFESPLSPDPVVIFYFYLKMFLLIMSLVVMCLISLEI